MKNAPERTSQNRVKKRKNSNYKDIFRRFFKNKAAVFGLIILVLLICLGIYANIFIPYSEVIDVQSDARLQSPSSNHIFGTDQLGRDVFSRIAYGTEYSLSIGFITMLISLILGAIFGGIAGYAGNKADNIIMRICDVFQSIPATLMSLAIVTALGANFINLVIALVIASTPSMIRIVRSSVLSISKEDYIEAARSYQASKMRIMIKYVLPNAMGPIIVTATMNMAGMILSAAGLSYLGMGVQPPTPEWGSMLSDAEEYIRIAPYLLYYPGIAIVLASLSINLVGDGLRDALDPRLKN